MNRNLTTWKTYIKDTEDSSYGVIMSWLGWSCQYFGYVGRSGRVASL